MPLACVVGRRTLVGGSRCVWDGATCGKEPAVMSSLTSRSGLVYLGMDTSKDSIVVGVLSGGEQVPVIDRVFNDEVSIRRLISRFEDVGVLRCCYEAGPCGYELHRLLTSLGVANQVIAPSLIPKGSGDRVKTDRRDAARLTRLLRAGELTAIRVPSPGEEAVRDLIRVRADLMLDLRRTKQRLGALLLRHGKVWRASRYWTLEHRRWLAAVSFDESVAVGRSGAPGRSGRRSDRLPGYR